MANDWTFGRKVGTGLGATLALAIAIAAVGVYALRTVVTSKDRLIDVNAAMLTEAEHLSAVTAQEISAASRYLLTKQDRYLDEMRGHSAGLAQSLDRLRAPLTDAGELRLVEDIQKKEADRQAAIARLVALRRTDAASDVLAKAFDEEVAPKREALRQAVDAFVARQTKVLADAQRSSDEVASSAVLLVMVIAGVAIVFVAALAVYLTRTLSRQIGSSVGQVQSSSSELQAAANQQATGAKEQSTAMTEIATTITELLATSRQIAESAQRVARVAEQTVSAAGAGGTAVEKGHESAAAMRRQVELVVGHMLDLGKKSQQIGAVLDIVSELADQTNILAINATIEAAGAGEAGKRFGVVAEEIRKLADRVGGSTKEVRGLIDDVRAAVNTTVMTTEAGSKAVDAGARQFAEVATAFKDIAGLVGTTTEAAREIELSTKQQATAVEQVNVAIMNVAQASRETEASSSQTLKAVSQLSGLSRELLRMVQAEAA